MLLPFDFFAGLNPYSRHDVLSCIEDILGCKLQAVHIHVQLTESNS